MGSWKLPDKKYIFYCKDERRVKWILENYCIIGSYYLEKKKREILEIVVDFAPWIKSWVE